MEEFLDGHDSKIKEGFYTFGHQFDHIYYFTGEYSNQSNAVFEILGGEKRFFFSGEVKSLYELPIEEYLSTLKQKISFIEEKVKK